MRAILFVCAGNICRSPIAEARFRQTMGSRPGLSALEIGSAGTIALDGNPAAPNAVRAARDEFGLDITGHCARNIEGLDADLILAMDGMVTRDLLRLSLTGRVELLGTYAGTGEIVEDPYGCPIEVYRACARHLDRLIQAAAARLEQELRNPGSSSRRP